MCQRRSGRFSRPIGPKPADLYATGGRLHSFWAWSARQSGLALILYAGRSMETDNPTLTEKLASAIADGILNGSLKPGCRLDEAGLARQHGVSRTPVREALRQLTASGLIDMRP